MNFDQMDFTPSADGTLDNMKYGGIDVSEIAQELKDNCDDAGSKNTDIYILPKDSTDSKLSQFIIHDDGRGMNQEKLWNAIILGKRHEHTDDDIGKFGLGLKNATMGLGDHITIVSKTLETSAIGIFLNIPDMRSLNTFKPTQYESDASALRGQFPSLLWDAFCNSNTGTMISVNGIHEHHVYDVMQLAKEVHRSLNFNYTDSVTSKTTIRTTVVPGSKDLHVSHVDAFYRLTPENLAYCHETELRVYSSGRSNTVYEVLTEKRKRGAKMITGTKDKPLYYEMKPLNSEKATSDAVHSPVTSLPSGKYKTLMVRFVEVNGDSYDKEGQKSDWEGFDTRRRGFFFRRGKRIVGACMALEEKLDDWSNRLRMEVTFSPALDLQMGVRTQKQMSRSLHSTAISDALRVLWRQLSAPRIKARKDANKSDSDEDTLTNFGFKSKRITPSPVYQIPQNVLFPIAPETNAEDQEVFESSEVTEIYVTQLPEKVEDESVSTESPSDLGNIDIPNIPQEPKLYETVNGYLRLLDGDMVIGRIPSSVEGLEDWISNVSLPIGKTRQELFGYISKFWGLN